MTDENSAQNTSENTKTKLPKPSRRLVAILAAGLLVIGAGITGTSVGVANAAADETARLCAVALKAGASASTSATASIAAADAALEAVKSVTLPSNGGTSTEYSARPAVKAVKAVPAVEAVPASDGNPGTAAVAGVEAVPARLSGAERINIVNEARSGLVKIKIPTKCTERDQAAAITTLVGKAKTRTETLERNVKALNDDFAAFQVDEAARIAAEIEAARVAAAAEAARVAAEAAAAAAAAAAAHAAAQHAAPPRSSSGGVKGGSSAPRPPSSGGGGGSSGTPGGGGGQVGSGGNTGPPRCDNGMGGTMPC